MSFPRQSRVPIGSFFPDLIDPATMRALAVLGVDEARKVGVTYADIRIADTRSLAMGWSDPVYNKPDPSTMDFEYAYGIRVYVGGVWGFAFGVDPNSDSIVRAARVAVSTARSVAKLVATGSELAPVPIVRGEWATSFAIDPFSVSPDEHAKLLGAYADAIGRVRDAAIASLQFRWTAETRVFASSEGSLITQRFMRSDPRATIYAKPFGAHPSLGVPVTDVTAGSVGFESVVGPIPQERIKATAEEVVRLARYPFGQVEVGRYEAVVDGTAMAAVLGATLAPALELERALGYHADGVGTSFLAPVSEVLGVPLFSPHLNVVADRTAPHYGAAQWDDEGVATTAFPVIEHGTIVNYFATRATVPALRDWSSKTGKPLTNFGASVAWAPTVSPIGCASQMVMTGGPPGTNLEALTAQLANGILVRNVNYSGVLSDQQLMSGAFCPWMLYEVKRGRITRQLQGGLVQFNTKQFWKAITALGDARTMQCYVHSGVRGETQVATTQPMIAPAAHLTALDVVRRNRA